MSTITDLTTADVRFPTSRELDGSDAMNPDPDYSAAYVTLHTDGEHQGVALVFTEGRGNEIVVAAMESLRGHVVGRRVDTLEDVNAISRLLIGDSHLRWLGPEKGVMHMAIGGVVNATWDIFARQQGKPLWLLLGELTPEQIVASIDFRYLTDAIRPEQALTLLTERAEGKADRIAQLREHGFPAYTTTPGWLGYSDSKLVRLSHEAVEQGFDMIKLKVGGDLESDRRRLRLAREAVGPDVRIGVDANQIWDVPVAIDWMRQLAEFDPYWIEEPTSPDDVLGHRDIRTGIHAVAPSIKVATGEHCQNRIIAKQLMAAEAIDVFQLDSARMGGVNELLAVLLLALRFDVPVVPHAGGVGLCEMVQHYAMADFVAFSGTTADRYLEYIDHLHEHFAEPVRLVEADAAAYAAPSRPGNGAEILAASIAEYRYPDGPVWADSTTEGSVRG